MIYNIYNQILLHELDSEQHKTPELSPLMRPLYLTTAEKQQLLSFLNTLTGADVDKLVDDAMKAPIGDHQVTYSAKLSATQH